mmetsp:Transcript_32104/g.73861  ORF Transcript_32104/g.73861 Transcript_32104/m.73861 type:complete len:221 (+) Transcript_32104:106-768(+)
MFVHVSFLCCRSVTKPSNRKRQRNGDLSIRHPPVGPGLLPTAPAITPTGETLPLSSRRPYLATLPPAHGHRMRRCLLRRRRWRIRPFFPDPAPCRRRDLHLRLVVSPLSIQNSHRISPRPRSQFCPPPRHLDGIFCGHASDFVGQDMDVPGKFRRHRWVESEALPENYTYNLGSTLSFHLAAVFTHRWKRRGFDLSRTFFCRYCPVAECNKAVPRWKVRR